MPYRAAMERSFGQDFSGVQAHLGRSSEMAALGAHAAAQGEHVAFATGNPSRELVAHELAHVVQQRYAGSVAADQHKGEVSDPEDASEREADQVAAQVAAGERVTVREAPSSGLHRDVADLTRKFQGQIDQGSQGGTPDKGTLTGKPEGSKGSVSELTSKHEESVKGGSPEAAVADAVTRGDAVALAGAATTDELRRKAVELCIARAKAGLLLTVAGGAGDGGPWRACVSATQYDQIIALAPSPVSDKKQFEGVWHLWGNGTDRSPGSARVTFDHLFTSRILAPGDTSAVWPGVKHTDNTGSEWEMRTVYLPVTPAAATFKRYMTSIRHLPQGHVNAANIAFCAQSQYQYKQTKLNGAPFAGVWTNQGPAASLSTSYYLAPSNTVVMILRRRRRHR